MHYAAFTLQCRFLSEAHVSPFKGSAFRGLFGHSLKKTVCALRLRNCQDCILHQRCVYCNLFESHKAKPPAGNGKTVTSMRPHPFVLAPPLNKTRHFKTDDTFEFHLILFGEAVFDLPYLICCVEEMGQTGVGAKNKEGCGKFILEQVIQNNQAIYDSQTKILNQNKTIENISLQEPRPEEVRCVEVQFVTPLRLKYKNHLTDQLDFHVLIRACLRRLAVLEEYFGKGEPDINYKDLVKRAHGITVTASDLKWQEVLRYSSRQKTGMQIGGVTGHIRYEGDITPFLPVLKYCEKVHIGKQTAFGHGEIRVLGVSN